ncbi:hypothetical protein C5O22_03030 [Treponema sp. J25]|nr:hypothetical protein C5O22_03030 [Treponema sp. J25]
MVLLTIAKIEKEHKSSIPVKRELLHSYRLLYKTQFSPQKRLIRRKLLEFDESVDFLTRISKIKDVK